MSGKLFNPLEDPPTASSSSDEDELETSIGGEEGTEGTSSCDDSSRIPITEKPETLNQKPSGSENGSEEDAADSESETEGKDQTTNPEFSVVKSVTEAANDSVVKNPDSKKVKSYTQSLLTKRSNENNEGAASTDVKRVKTVSGEDEKKNGGEDTKKNYFQRVWSEEDEIVVLQGIIDYKTENGVSPFDDTNGFYLLLKKSISFDVTKIQFMEKLRSFKKKFENILGKSKNPTFVKSHERKAFDLSKLIWGANGIAFESSVRSNGKSKKSHSKKVEPVNPIGKLYEDENTNKGEGSVLGVTELDTFAKSILVKSLVRFGVDDLVAQQGWSKLASEDKKRFEEQWKTLQLKEFEFYSQKSGFIHEVVSKMAEAVRSNP